MDSFILTAFLLMTLATYNPDVSQKDAFKTEINKETIMANEIIKEIKN